LSKRRKKRRRRKTKTKTKTKTNTKEAGEAQLAKGSLCKVLNSIPSAHVKSQTPWHTW
jgi:hypothetical protein